MFESCYYFEEGLPVQACLNQNQALKIWEELPALKLEGLGSASDCHLFEVFKAVLRRVQVVVGDRELL